MALSPLQLIKVFGEHSEFIKAAIEAGTSFTETLSALREGGLGIAESNARTIYDYLSGPLNAGREYVSSLGLNAIPNVANVRQSTTTLLRNFSYVVEINGKDKNTGEAVTRHVTISTNTLLTKQEAADTAAGVVAGNSEYEMDEIDPPDVVDILQNSEGFF